MTFVPVEAVAAIGELALPAAAAPAAHSISRAGFGEMLLDGIDATSRRITDAQATVRAFVLDDSVPVHQVTFALEQARLSLELMSQVRSHLIQGYQQLMNMQL